MLDFDETDVGSLDQQKIDESKIAELERSVMRILKHLVMFYPKKSQYFLFLLFRITPNNSEPTAAQENDTRDGGKSQCMSSKYSDSSDWAPYAG